MYALVCTYPGTRMFNFLFTMGFARSKPQVCSCMFGLSQLLHCYMLLAIFWGPIKANKALVFLHFFLNFLINIMLDKEIATIFQHAQVMDSRIPRPQSGQRCGFSSVFLVKIYEDLPVFHGFSMGFPWVFRFFPRCWCFFSPVGLEMAGGSWQPDRRDGSTICCPQAVSSPHHVFWVNMNERRD